MEVVGGGANMYENRRFEIAVGVVMGKWKNRQLFPAGLLTQVSQAVIGNGCFIVNVSPEKRGFIGVFAFLPRL